MTGKYRTVPTKLGAVVLGACIYYGSFVVGFVASGMWDLFMAGWRFHL
jgi:hypothetical protein